MLKSCNKAVQKTDGTAVGSCRHDLHKIITTKDGEIEVARSLANWTIVEYGSLDMPEKAEFDKKRCFYTILTKKGQVLTAYPKYPEKDALSSIPTWHAPSIGEIYPWDVIAFTPIEIPWTLIDSLRNESANKNKAFTHIYKTNT